MLLRELPYTGHQIGSWFERGILKEGVHYYRREGVIIYDLPLIDQEICRLRRVPARVPKFYQHQTEPPTAEDLAMLDLFRPSAFLHQVNDDRLSVFALRRLFQAGYVNLRTVNRKLLVEVVKDGTA